MAVDFELFKMLAAHAATALVGAMLYAHADGKLPGVDVFRDCPPGTAERAGSGTLITKGCWRVVETTGGLFVVSFSARRGE